MVSATRALFVTLLVVPVVSPARAEPHFPTVAEASSSLASGDLDTVYLAFGAIRHGQHPEGDATVATMLVQGARLAAKSKDWALSVGFASKARYLAPKNVDACLAEADAAIEIKNPGEAEEALQAAVDAAPSNWPLVLRRARFAHEEGEDDLARDFLQRIPPEAPEAAPAQKLLAEMNAALEKSTRARAKLDQTQSEAAPPPQRAAAGASGPVARTATAAEGSDAIPGYAARASEHFRITYSEGQRDFAQKAGYEQQCLDLFERAYARVHQALGQASEHPTEVVLYTRQEFELHFGGRFGNGLLGFYAGKIRMNRADTIDDSFFDTAVHEYTHAVIDSMSGGHRIPAWVHEGTARWVERMSAGNDPADAAERRHMKHLLVSGPLPPLAFLADHSFAELGGPMVPVAYAKSALAIDLVTRTGTGLSGLERAIRGVRDGRPFEETFAAEFGSARLGLLDGEVARALE